MLAFTNLEGEHCRCHAAAIRKHDNPLARLEITKWNKKGKHQFSSMSIRTEENAAVRYIPDCHVCYGELMQKQHIVMPCTYSRVALGSMLLVEL
jgi:hypothetical protein